MTTTHDSRLPPPGARRADRPRPTVHAQGRAAARGRRPPRRVPHRDGVAKAINGVSFDLYQGETLAILGESGSGKSVTAQAIMGILDMPPARIPHGQIRYCGQDLLTMPEEERRKTRGPEISMIFQDALSSLNPVFPVGWQIAEMFRHAPRHEQVRRPGPGGQAHAAGPDPRGQGARQGLPAPVLRRYAPAHHDRDGHRARPGGAHRRRAHDRPRRDRPGADHGPARRSCRRSARWGSS